MIKVIYNKTCGRCVQSEPLTSGMVGQTIHFDYSHDFDGLAATAVFTDGKNTVNVVNPGNECIIPHEVLTTVGAAVKVGIYAVRGDELVIPTVYATIGFVLKGADPNGGISEDPTLPVWAQTQAMIGNLNALETQAKENLVLAINEVKQTADSKQNTISDLEAIRTGAAKGATALQSVPSAYRTASEQDTIDSGKVDKVTGKGLSTNDYTDTAKAKVDALAPVATSGSYNDLTDKPAIPDAVTEQTVSGWGFTKNTGTYSKPTGGIPKTDLANDVQASLGKAETALQEHQSLAAYRTAVEQDIIDNGKQDKLIAGENITIAADGKTISATGGGSSVPKPLTYDYMPEGYPTKSGQTTTLMEEQEVEFVEDDIGYLTDTLIPLEIVVGQTYTVNWDGTEYECLCVVTNPIPALGNQSFPALGNQSIYGWGDDTGEPFFYGYVIDLAKGQFTTLETSPSHTIGVKTIDETIVPMAEEFIPKMNVSAFTNDAGYLTLDTLPNPKPLTFTGAVTGSYDGSEALNIEIPVVENIETVESQLVDIPSKLSQFTNDTGYLTLDTLPKYDGSVIAE